MNNYDHRWNFVLNWAKNVQEHLKEGYLLWDGTTCFEGECLFIKENHRYIYLQRESVRWLIFEGDLRLDHGAYTPIPELRKELEELKLLKPSPKNLFRKRKQQ